MVSKLGGSTVVVVLLIVLGRSLATVSPVVAGGPCYDATECSMDKTRTASITVTHGAGAKSLDAVEPDTGETWSVTANYQLASDGLVCDCDTRTDSVTVDVDWSDSTGWSAVCTGCGSGAIVAVSVCDSRSCPGDLAIRHSWAYELIVDVETNHDFRCGPKLQSGALTSVDFKTTSIDDGVKLSNCSHGSGVSPTSQSFSVTDSGPFECPFTCADAAGPAVTITYQ